MYKRQPFGVTSWEPFVANLIAFILMVTDLALNSSQIDEGSVERAIQEAQEVLKARSEMSRQEQARFEANLTKQIMMLNFKRKHKSPGR